MTLCTCVWRLGLGPSFHRIEVQPLPFNKGLLKCWLVLNIFYIKWLDRFDILQSKKLSQESLWMANFLLHTIATFFVTLQINFKQLSLRVLHWKPIVWAPNKYNKKKIRNWRQIWILTAVPLQWGHRSSPFPLYEFGCLTIAWKWINHKCQ